MRKTLANLQSSLSRVRDITVDIDGNAQAALADSTVQARHETTLCAATVILSGFLESFLREVAEAVISDICNRAVPFSRLPDKIRITHFWEGANCLREIARQERSENPVVLAKASDAARRLASVGNPQPPYEIVWEAFAETQANPGPEQISAFLKRFDISDPLRTLAGAMKSTPNALELTLKSFMAIRNECAHTGSATNIPTTTDVRGFCDFIELLGTGILAVFQDRLGEPPYAAVPAAPQPNP
jgi:RiboL-PSP-HEPN